MAKIAAQPVLFKGAISVGTDEYTAHLNQAEWQPTQPTASFTDLDGKVTNFGGDSSWVLALAGAQDWDTVNSLSLWLNSHEGEEVTVEVALPGGGKATGTVIAAAVAIGGTINSPMVWSKTLQAQGAPVITAGT